MNRMLVVVFDNESAAEAGTRAMRQLHSEGGITLYAMGVVAKDSKGYVSIKEAADPGFAGAGTGLAVGALIGLLGLYLIWTALRLLSARQTLAMPAPAVIVTRQSTGLSDFASFEPKRTDPAENHIHGPDCGCGHTHLPETRDLTGDFSLTKAISLAFAVGIRPCTGAILMLLFANGLGLFWAGIASTFAMAIGTFITVSSIAAIAVYGKKLAARLMRGNSGFLEWAAIGLRMAGGVAIVFFGVILFFGSLGSTNAMM